MPEPITTTQLFNRISLAFLMSKEATLDPQQVSYLKTIYNSRDKKSFQGQREVRYCLNTKHKAGKLGYGRLYGTKGSYEMLEREIRGTMCAEFYYDIDVVNCHPVLFVQIADKYNKKLPITAHYNENRSEFLSKLSDNKEEAKMEILKTMYGGKPTIDALIPMWKELRTFTKYLMTVPRYSDLLEAVKYEDNIYGSFLSYVTQTEEVKVMLAMRESLIRQGWSVDVLCYDGVMIRKAEDMELTNDMLRLVEEHITRDTGYMVQLITKQFTSFDVPKDQKEEMIDGKISIADYKKMKEEFEVSRFYYSPTNTYAEVNNDGSISFYDKIHANNALRDNWLFTHSNKFGDYTPFFPLWDSDKERRTITNIDYKPSDDPLTFVMALNFNCEKEVSIEAPEAVELFKKLVAINTNNDPILGDYVLKWYAHLIQKPFDLPGVALVVTGAKGAGKDTLGDFMINNVVGNHRAYNYVSNEQFFEKHDVQRTDRFLIKLEEADASICGKNESTLKALITAQKNCVNPKGEKVRTSPNYVRYIFTTNKPVPVNIGENERRFVLLRTDNSYVGKTDFWNNIRSKLVNNAGAGKVVGDFLKTVDLSGFEIRQLPQNEYYESMKTDALTSEERFVAVWDGEEIGATELYNLYAKFCSESKLSYAQNVKTFGHRMAVLYRDNKVSRRSLNGCNLYSKQ